MFLCGKVLYLCAVKGLTPIETDGHPFLGMSLLLVLLRTRIKEREILVVVVVVAGNVETWPMSCQRLCLQGVRDLGNRSSILEQGARPVCAGQVATHLS